MKKLITACMGILLLSGCVLTKPSADEIASTYQTNRSSADKELMRERSTEKCSAFSYKKGKTQMSCRLVGDVIIFDIRLTDNRMEWSPKSQTYITKIILTKLCDDTVDNQALQAGFALLVNLQGPNGFAGKIKTYEDCKTL